MGGTFLHPHYNAAYAVHASSNIAINKPANLSFRWSSGRSTQDPMEWSSFSITAPPGLRRAALTARLARPAEVFAAGGAWRGARFAEEVDTVVAQEERVGGGGTTFAPG